MAVNRLRQRIVVAAECMGIPQRYFYQDRPWGVYLIGAAAESLVKVGFSGDFDGRLKNIRQQVPFAILTLALLDGADSDLEQQIHKSLAPWKKRGEWFYLTDASLLIVRRYFGEQLDEIALSRVYPHRKRLKRRLSLAIQGRELFQQDG